MYNDEVEHTACTGKAKCIQSLCGRAWRKWWIEKHSHILFLMTVQQDATYSVYYISVGSSTCFGWWYPSSGACTTVITASGID